MNKAVCVLAILAFLIPGVMMKNTLSVLSCRANQCFEEYYTCLSDKVCSEEYSKFNVCMQKECQASQEIQIDCYQKCKSKSNIHGSLQDYIKCTDNQCSSDSFYRTCGDAYQNLDKEQAKNSDTWKAFSKDLDKCVQQNCENHKSNPKELLYCRINQSIECSRTIVNSYRHVSFLNNFYECTSKEIANVSQDGNVEKNLFEWFLSLVGLSN